KSGQNIVLAAAGGSIGSPGQWLKTDHGAAATMHASSTTGSVYLWEVFGDLRIDTITAPLGDVGLRSHLSIIGTNGPAVDVRGNAVTLDTLYGGIGAAGDELNIDSS